MLTVFSPLKIVIPALLGMKEWKTIIRDDSLALVLENLPLMINPAIEKYPVNLDVFDCFSYSRKLKLHFTELSYELYNLKLFDSNSV